MAWFERPTTSHEKTTYSRLRQVYLLLKKWKEHLADLPLKPIPALESEELDLALGAETAPELLERLNLSLRAILEEWEPLLADPSRKNSPAWGRMLRLTEEEAVRYTSAQWKDVGSTLFQTVPEVFSAYRETPFATLYRGSALLLSSRAQRVEFLLRHPGIEIESAWLRGFTTVLRPGIQTSVKDNSSGMKTFQWLD